MKGLLLKDWYLMIKYCKSFLLIIILFTIFSFQGDENAFFIMYPCIMASMIPLTSAKSKPPPARLSACSQAR